MVRQWLYATLALGLLGFDPALAQDTAEPVEDTGADTALGPVEMAATIARDEGGSPWGDSCGCQAVGAHASWLSLLVVGLVAGRRRRVER